MLDQYEILNKLGSGGCGTVHRARQRTVDRIVAIKTLSLATIADETSLKRFQREAKIASSFEHPNIARVFSYGIIPEEGPYLVMEYLDGITLAQYLKEHRRLSPGAFNTIFRQVCSALQYAHNQGIIHRDIKSANIMLLQKGSGDEFTAKLLDFGIAKHIEDQSRTSGLTKTGLAVGTPLYMSPEQCMGKPCDNRSDIYSLGCVMYEAMSGCPPFFDETPTAVMMAHLHAEPPGFADLDAKLQVQPGVVALIRQCLNKDPAQRPQSAAEVEAALEKSSHEKPQRAGKLCRGNQINKKSNPAKAILTLTIAGAVISGMAATGFVMHNRAANHGSTSTGSVIARLRTMLEDARSNQQAGNLTEARNSYTNIISQAKNLKPELRQEAVLTSELLYNAAKGISEIDEHDPAEAAKALMDARHQQMDYAKRLFGPNSAEEADAAYKLADWLNSKDVSLPEAEALARRSAEIRFARYKALSQDRSGLPLTVELSLAATSHAFSMSLVACIEGKLGKSTRCLQDARHALEIVKQVALSPRIDYDMMKCMERLCLAYSFAHKTKEADAAIAEFLDKLNRKESSISPGEEQELLKEMINGLHADRQFKKERSVAEFLLKLSQKNFGKNSNEVLDAQRILEEIPRQ